MAVLSSGTTGCGVHASDVDIVPLHDGSDSFRRGRVRSPGLVWPVHLPSIWNSNMGCKTGELSFSILYHMGSLAWFTSWYLRLS